MLNVLFTSKYQIFLSDLFSWDIVRSFTWTQRLDRQQSGDLQSQIGADFPILARLCSLASIHFNHCLLTPWSLMPDGVNTLPDVRPWGPDGDWPRVWLWLRLRWRHPLHHTATCQLTPVTGTQATEDALVTRVKDSFHQNENLLRSDTAKQSRHYAVSQACSKGQTEWTLSLLHQGGIASLETHEKCDETSQSGTNLSGRVNLDPARGQ